jgi:hypothetical protein
MTVISSIEKSNGLAERKVMKGILKKGLPLALILVLSLVGNIAFAQAGGADGTTGTGDSDSIFTNVQTSVCAVAKGLKGPVGVAIGFLVLVGGLIAMQVANRDAIPMISRALVGTALLLGAGAAFTAIITTNNCT